VLLFRAISNHIENNLVDNIENLRELLLFCIKVFAAISLLDDLFKQKGGRLEEGIAHNLFFSKEQLVVLVDLCVRVLGHKSFDLIEGHQNKFFFCFFIK
jgi:hypothetical protein